LSALCRKRKKFAFNCFFLLSAASGVSTEALDYGTPFVRWGVFVWFFIARAKTPWSPLAMLCIAALKWAEHAYSDGTLWTALHADTRMVSPSGRRICAWDLALTASVPSHRYDLQRRARHCDVAGLTCQSRGLGLN
jgi:hypothetical protein